MRNCRVGEDEELVFSNSYEDGKAWRIQRILVIEDDALKNCEYLLGPL